MEKAVSKGALQRAFLLANTQKKLSNQLTNMTTPSESSESTPGRFSSTPTPLLSRRGDSRRIHGKTWSLTAHATNIRRNSQISRIWEHGAEYVNLSEPNTGSHWICDHCDSIIALRRSQSNWNASRHLLKAHNIKVKREINEEEEEQEERQAERREATFAALIARVNVDKFRELLIRWIVQSQIPYSAVKSEAFRDLLLCLQPGIERYLVRSHNTIASWVDEEYQKGRQVIKSQLQQSLSRIHFSFDIWTSPACTAILGICAHFLAPNLHLKHALIDLKAIEGAHQGETIAELVGDLIQWFELEQILGVFIGDNAGNVDTAVKALVRRFRLDSSKGRRARCCGHIINLAAKAFLLGNDCEAFIDEIDAAEHRAARDEQYLAVQQAKWRSQGPVGKFHNIVAYIRATSQRRHEFKEAVQMSINRARARGTRLTYLSLS